MVETLERTPVGVLRVVSGILNRIRLRGSGLFGGKRNVYDALGYVENPTLEDYELRYERGDIAARIVEIHPKSTWSAGIEVVESENPKKLSRFEKAVKKMAKRTNLWPTLLRADILSGIGEYAVVLIGAPGELDQEIPDGRGNPDNIYYLTPFRQSRAAIESYEEDIRNPRFGRPKFYQINNITPTTTIPRRVHHSRIIHVAEITGDSNYLAAPRLKKVFNKLDDLDKIVGGGSEAFWKSVYQGLQLDVDPEVDFDPEEKEALSTQIDEYEHNMRRIFRTRGVDVRPIGVQAVDFSPQAMTVLDFICATIGAPKRIFLGSERGELASSQDQEAWEDTIGERRANFAEPLMVNPFIQLLIDKNYLPNSKDYRVAWPERNKLTHEQKAVVAQRLATVNKMMGMPVISDGDIRDKVLGWDMLSDEERKLIPIPGTTEKDGRVNGPPPANQPSKTKEVSGDNQKVVQN